MVNLSFRWVGQGCKERLQRGLGIRGWDRYGATVTAMNLMKKRFRQLGWFLGITAALVALGIGVERFRGQHALNARVAELKARGERLMVAELEPRRPSAERNAVLALLGLTNALSPFQSNSYDLPPAGRFAAPGRMMTVWQFDTWAEDKKTNDWWRVIQMTDESTQVLQAIHAALQRPEWDTGFNYRNGFFDFQSPPLAHFKLVSRMLTTAVACDLKQGRSNAAVERLTDAIRLLRLQKDDRLIISQLVRIACVALTWNSTWGLLQTNAWSEPQLATLQAAWQDMDFAAEMGRALEMERAMSLDSFALARGSPTKLYAQFEQAERAADEFGGAFLFLPTHGAVLHWIHLPLWRVAWADQDARRELDSWQDGIEIDRTARKASWAEAKILADRLNVAAAEGNAWPLMQSEESN